ncbi:MAG TPA: DUF835 domain-containing protein [Thermoplasmata archaeon]|jgi:hypothetical protein|nr:DUF835 domain-containing protein [Thermoplasmata archaeon]
MVEAAQWYSLISISSSSIALLLSAYVVRKIPNRRAGDTFVLAMVFFVLAGTFAYLLRTSTLDYYGSNAGPLAIARLFYFFHMLAVGFTASFIGQYFLGFALMRRRIVTLFLQVSLLVVAIGVALQVNNLEDEYGGIGVVIEDAGARATLALFATIFMSTALAVLLRTWIRNKEPTVHKQTLLMTVGVVAHGVGAETYAVSRIFWDLYPPPFLTVTALAMAACFAVAVLRYKMLVVTPQKEEAVSLPRRFSLKGGRAYLVRERRPKTVFLALAESVRSGSLGLVVTRRAPVEVREDYDLPATPIVWLTSALGPNCVPPTDLGALERAVRDFLGERPQGVVALEGLEYLATYNPPGKLLRALHSFRDLATAGGGVLLVSADLGATEESVAQVLEREFEPLELPRTAGYTVEDVFVIEASGLLLTHASRDDNARIDSDVMAGMLTAIMNFARTSFASGSAELRRLELGEKTVLIERSPRFILAVAARGAQPKDAQEEMRAFLDRAERRYGPLVAKWSGDTAAFPGLQAMTSRLFL